MFEKASYEYYEGDFEEIIEYHASPANQLERSLNLQNWNLPALEKLPINQRISQTTINPFKPIT